jgi:sialate O-acetylesterase
MPSPSRFAVVLLLSCVLVCSGASYAEVNLPAVISENLVLQRGMKVPVWGTADAGEDVTVKLGEQKATVKAGADGKWKVQLGPLEAGGPLTMTVAGKNTIELKNVLVGEVWVCSGQSNMQMSVRDCLNAKDDIAAANFPKIRLFTVPTTVADTPQSDCKGRWSECSPETVGGFSGAAYFFGRELHKTLNVPIGLIHTSWGGTPAESWTSKPALEADADFKPILERFAKSVADYPAAKENYPKRLEKWKEDSEKAKAEGKPASKKPDPPGNPDTNPWKPSGLYNAMIAPLLPYGIQGAIWYQGESNAGRAYQYRKLFAAMIQDWRKNWGQGDFPFVWVQLANFMARKPQPAASDWAELREAQQMTLALPKTGTGLAIDIGDAQNIHPKNKQELGRRLALAALAIAYGKDIPYSGPVYDSMAIAGSSIRLKFKHVNGGLVCKGEKLAGFAIAGEDKNFVWGDAKIDGETVVVSSPQVQKPVAVRYAWADNPEVSLYNKADLPASPFRTDDWDGKTKGKL